ncbi:MAG: hypothetical protein ACREEH_07940 [Caulobacteraceae bacterium]
MSGILPFDPVIRAIAASGEPISGAQLQFYETGTTTPTPAYTDATLGTALANPLLSDSGGLFVPAFLDPTVTYRVQLKDGSGNLIRDVDPITGSIIAATEAQVNAGTATGVYVEPATLATWRGVPTALGYTPLNQAGDTATNLQLGITTLAVASAGYRGCPVNEQDGDYTFVLADSGKLVRGSVATGIAWTIPPNSSVAFPIGTVIAVRNVGAGTITLTRGSGVTQAIAGSGTNKDVALAQYGFASLVQENANVWCVAGTGVS